MIKKVELDGFTADAIKKSLEDVGEVTSIETYEFGSGEVCFVEAKGRIVTTNGYSEESNRIIDKGFLAPETTDIIVVDNGVDFQDGIARFVIVFDG